MLHKVVAQYTQTDLDNMARHTCRGLVTARTVSEKRNQVESYRDEYPGVVAPVSRDYLFNFSQKIKPTLVLDTVDFEWSASFDDWVDGWKGAVE